MTQSEAQGQYKKLGNIIHQLFRIALIAVLIGGGFYGWSLITNPQVFPIRYIKIYASFQHVQRDLLQQTILPYVNVSFFQLNTQQLQQSLEQIPWVADAEIERDWPDTISIKINEQQAAARWAAGGLINTQGQLFSAPDSSTNAQLPLLNGPPGQASVAWQYYQQASALLSSLKLAISSLDMTARHALRITLTDGTIILTGQDDIWTHLQRFIRVYPKIFTDPNLKAQIIDLRYDNGLAITWRNKLNNNS